MKKTLLPILSTIFSLTSLLIADKTFAQTQSDRCHDLQDYYSKLAVCPHNDRILTQEKWRKLVKQYYLTRYRTKFEPNNDFLSIKEVNDLLGFAGNRSKVRKRSSHQYLTWKDEQDPSKKIEAVFIYHHLVGLRSRGFDRNYLRQLKTQISTNSAKSDL